MVCCEFGLPTRIFDSHMARELNVLANSIGLVVLEAATPESLEAVVDRWLDTHMTTEVVAMDMQTTGVNGPLYMCITFKKERGLRKA